MTGQEDQIGGFDLICKGEPIMNESGRNTTMLGCYNNRSQQLKTLSKVIAAKLAQNYVAPNPEPSTNPKRTSKDITQGLPVISASTEASITSRKLRSKSSAKGPPSSSGPSILNQTSKATKTLFPKQVISVMTKGLEETEYKENNRESSAPTKQNRFRIFKGKTVILPPVNNSSTNTINVPSNNTLTSVSNSNQLDSQKTIFHSNHVVNQTPSLINDPSISNRSVQPVGNSDSNIKLSQQQPLAASLSAYSTGKGAYSINAMNTIHTEPNSNSPIQASSLLGLKAKNENSSFNMAYNQTADFYEKSSPLQRKVKKDTLSASQDLGKTHEGDDVVKMYTESDRELNKQKDEPKKLFAYSPTKNSLTP